MLGVIEGFYGTPWTESARLELVSGLADWGFRFYLYAPKADPYLRDRWREEHPVPTRRRLERLGAHAHARGLDWGVGLSPLGLAGDEREGRTRLAARARSLRALGADILGVLFDDMPGTTPRLARRQADLVARAADAFAGRRVVMCPTYYSSDPRLDAYYGPRPPDYLETLGRFLDPAVGVFWTGPRVCSTRYPPAHLDAVATALRRPPLLWDNYPVNDGPEMWRFLHLRAFSRRGPGVRRRTAGIAANPMNQCALSALPPRTLPWNLERKRHNRAAATATACRALYPPLLANLLLRDIETFQDRGLDAIPAWERHQLVEEYAAVDHAAAAEVVHWLEERSRIGREAPVTP